MHSYNEKIVLIQSKSKLLSHQSLADASVHTKGFLQTVHISLRQRTELAYNYRLRRH